MDIIHRPLFKFYMVNIGVGLVAEFWKPLSGNRQVPVVSKLVEQLVCVLTPANISRSGAVLQVCFPLGRCHGIILDSLIFRRPVRVDGLPANGRHLDIKAAGEDVCCGDILYPLDGNICDADMLPDGFIREGSSRFPIIAFVHGNNIGDGFDAAGLIFNTGPAGKGWTDCSPGFFDGDDITDTVLCHRC